MSCKNVSHQVGRLIHVPYFLDPGGGLAEGRNKSGRSPVTDAFYNLELDFQSFFFKGVNEVLDRFHREQLVPVAVDDVEGDVVNEGQRFLRRPGGYGDGGRKQAGVTRRQVVGPDASQAESRQQDFPFVDFVIRQKGFYQAEDGRFGGGGCPAAVRTVGGQDESVQSL